MTATFQLELRGERIELPADLLRRYDVYAPRYTSYPTAPEWLSSFGPRDALAAFARADVSRPISLYFHIPFCQSLCWFCGCNVVINRDKAVAEPYLDHVLRELDMVASNVDTSRPVVQHHWGGGTPTYLSPDQMARLFRATTAHFTIAPGAEVAVEVDPRVTTPEHVAALAELGMNRVSMGVQDFDEKVQQAVHRIQPFEITAALVDDCRAHGFGSVNIDLMYGLPYQTPESFAFTVDRIIEISPDRIALFNYAHVPQLRHAQNAFRRMPMPAGFDKFEIFRSASERLTRAGYVYIGLDHFAKPDDELAVAQRERTLHRNFQGYTTCAGSDLYALGVSSISFVANTYIQSFRDTAPYYDAIERSMLPTMRGMTLDDDDLLRATVIERLLCHCELVPAEIEREFGIDFAEYFADALADLAAAEQDGMVRISADRIQVTPLGQLFVRNLAVPFDAYLRRRAIADQPVFSRTL
jgi:oxygen-independent coproporphyrinogen-3 oxidase